MNVTPKIHDTGPRGFLKWFRREQPAIYAQIAPKLQKLAPQAFSSYMGGGWRRYKLGDTVDTADAANAGSATGDWANVVSQLINSASGAFQTYEQQQTQQQIIGAQLTQASLGRPPLNLSLGQSGVPQISFGATAQGTTNIGTLLLYGVLGYAGLKLLKVI